MSPRTQPTSMVLHRLDLELVERTDVDWIHQHWRRPEVRQWLWDDRELDRDEVESLVAPFLNRAAWRTRQLWVARLRRTGDRVGVFGYYEGTSRVGTEVCFSLEPLHWSRQLAHEAMAAVIGWYFVNTPGEALWGVVDAGNVRSVGTLERLGFEHRPDAVGNLLVALCYERRAWLDTRP